MNIAWRPLLAAGGGLRGLAFRAIHPDTPLQGLDSQGVAHSDVLEFERFMADDSERLRFSVVRLEQDAPSDLRFLYCYHHRPELLWTAQAVAHPNGAVAMTRLFLRTDQPQATGALMHRIRAISTASDPGHIPVDWEGSTSCISMTCAGSGPVASLMDRATSLGLSAVQTAAGALINLEPFLPLHILVGPGGQA